MREISLSEKAPLAVISELLRSQSSLYFLKAFSSRIIRVPMRSHPRHTSEIHADGVDDWVSEIELLHTVITDGEKNIAAPLSVGTENSRRDAE